DVHDASRFRRDHELGGDNLRCTQRRAQVEREHIVETLERQPFGGRPLIDTQTTGDVHQTVDGSYVAERRIDGAVIARIDNAPDVDVRHRETFRIDIEPDDARARGTQRVGDRSADATTTGAGDDEGSARK